MKHLDKEERFNSLTHLLGAFGAVIGTAVLLLLAFEDGSPWKITSFSIYGGSLILLYTFSALYHYFHGKLKRIFQKLDHLAIYLLIAGSYTPFIMVTLRNDIGWSFFSFIWILAIIGMAIEFFPRKGKRILPVIIYLVMGWLAIIIAEPLWNALSFEGFSWLIAGGLLYTVGVVFYALSDTYRYAHGIWHLFVLGGSFSHFVTVYQYVA
jgi:hemolysin III